MVTSHEVVLVVTSPEVGLVVTSHEVDLVVTSPVVEYINIANYVTLIVMTANTSRVVTPLEWWFTIQLFLLYASNSTTLAVEISLRVPVCEVGLLRCPVVDVLLCGWWEFTNVPLLFRQSTSEVVQYH